MQNFIYIEMNGLAIIILFIIFINIRNKNDKYLTEQKLFSIILILNAVLLLMDTFTWVLSGTNSPSSRLLILLATTLYYLLHPVICSAWSLYIDFQINRNSVRVKKLICLTLLPITINSVLSVLSAFGNYYFYIDKSNVYHRGQITGCKR